MYVLMVLLFNSLIYRIVSLTKSPLAVFPKSSFEKCGHRSYSDIKLSCFSMGLDFALSEGSVRKLIYARTTKMDLSGL